jgi:hypothetical protein
MKTAFPASIENRAIVAEETAEFKSRDERQKASRGDAAADSGSHWKGAG